jgi:hypothetical protein
VKPLTSWGYDFLMDTSDSLPPSGTKIDILAVFPFGTSGKELGPHGEALVERTLDIMAHYEVGHFLEMGGFSIDGEVWHKEALLFRKCLRARALARKIQLPCSYLESVSLDSYQQLEFTEMVTKKLGLTHPVVVAIAIPEHFRRIKMLVLGWPGFRGYAIRTAEISPELWSQNAKGILASRDKWILREIPTYILYRLHLGKVLSTALSHRKRVLSEMEQCIQSQS